MRDPDNSHNSPRHPRRLTKRGQIVLTIVLIVVLLLAGLLYSQHQQIHLFIQSLSVPMPQPVHITPLTLPPSTVTATPVPTTGADWTMYHQNIARTGFVVGVPDPTHLMSLWRQHLDGAVYAEPLVIGGQVIVATEHDTLYALDARTGQIKWHTTVGTPVPLSNLPCGNIDPLGITGTPVYDLQTGLVFAVAEIQGPAHVLVGVDSKTGQVKVRRIVDPPGADPQVHQQRAAWPCMGERSILLSVGWTATVATTTAWLSPRAPMGRDLYSHTRCRLHVKEGSGLPRDQSLMPRGTSLWQSGTGQSRKGTGIIATRSYTSHRRYSLRMPLHRRAGRATTRLMLISARWDLFFCPMD